MRSAVGGRRSAMSRWPPPWKGCKPASTSTTSPWLIRSPGKRISRQICDTRNISRGMDGCGYSGGSTICHGRNASTLCLERSCKTCIGVSVIILRSIFILIILQVSGCVIGNGRICGPQTPLVLCDKEAEKALYHPTPLRDYWRNTETQSGSLNRAWIECGGDGSGSYVNNQRRPGESMADLSMRDRNLFYNIQRCMMMKNYRYDGPCEPSVWRVAPACQARLSGAQ
ncbi:hypothetical protein FHY19_002843 [Xanthomonas arboricola]|nr:hypothetical protein [Xanthomonas sp. 4461]